MHEIFLQDLAIVMLVAGFVTILFHRFKQPVVLGYMLAGVIIGPNIPPFLLIHDRHVIELLAELGMVFLMFGLGMHFSLRKFVQVGPTALLAALLEIGMMIWVGYMLGRYFGWDAMNSIFLGAILSVSSTTIIVKALQDLGKSKEKFAKVIFGILIVEDILGIALIALLSSIAMTGSLQPAELFETVLRLTVFLTAVMVFGLIAVPRLLRYVNRFNSNEMLLVTVLGVCFGVSLLAIKLGYSVVLGAFLIGTIVAESRESPRIVYLVEPIKDMFSAVFFVAIGMLFDPRVLLEYAFPIAAITVAVVAGKVITCSVGTFLAGQDLRTSLRVGSGLAQIGEFSFIIAALGLTLGVTEGFLYPIAVTVSSITTLLTPYLIRSADPIVNFIERITPPYVTDSMRLYSSLGDRLAESQGPDRRIRLLMWKWAGQIALNLFLVAGFFFFASAAVRWTDRFPDLAPTWAGGTRTALWFGAVLLSLPLLIATFRKLRGVGMVISEFAVKHSATQETNQAARSLVSNVFVTLSSVIVGVAVLLLGAALLPPWPVLVFLGLVIVALCTVLWRSFIRVYAKGQIALRDTLATPAVEPETLTEVPRLLASAHLLSLELPDHSFACRKTLKDVDLRAETGASIIGFERGGQAIVNPGRDVELEPLDMLLLLGDDGQLEAARVYLTER